LREESFAPQCNEAGGVEMTRMNSPKTHEAVKRRRHPQRCLTDAQADDPRIAQRLALSSYLISFAGEEGIKMATCRVDPTRSCGG
jgi:hypothetical protein